MSENQGKRKAGFIAKLIGTSAWGLLLWALIYFNTPKEIVGFDKPEMGQFLMVGLCWPVVWAFFAGCRLLLPMPIELVPRLFEAILVGPGHLAAWILFGKKGKEPKPDAK